ncbi:FAD-binding protein [Bacillus sp. SL00103]
MFGSAPHIKCRLPRGSGTNLCAGTCPTQGGLVMLFTRMNQFIEIDEENDRNGQPGLITQELIREVEARAFSIHQIKLDENFDVRRQY